ncbi:hypothetical protein D3C76_743110 [compost metagenome]
MELRDFQREVGATGQQPGFGVRAVEVGQVRHGQGHQATFVATVELADVLGGNSLQARDGLRFARIELIAAGLAAGLFGGSEDRPVAGAAAEVAGQGFLSLVQIRCVAVLLQGEKRHDKARCAEPALGAMAVGHGLLHAVQLALVLEVFDADQLLAMQGRDERQARIQAAVADMRAAVVIRGQLADHHGTSAAIAAGTAFFGAGFTQVLTQVLEHCQVRIQGVLTAQLLVK